MRTSLDKWHRFPRGWLSFLSPNQRCQSTERNTLSKYTTWYINKHSDCMSVSFQLRIFNFSFGLFGNSNFLYTRISHQNSLNQKSCISNVCWLQWTSNSLNVISSKVNKKPSYRWGTARRGRASWNLVKFCTNVDDLYLKSSETRLLPIRL